MPDNITYQKHNQSNEEYDSPKWTEHRGESNYLDYIEAVQLHRTVEASANNGLGITQDYNKENRDRLWDSTERKADYKEKVFGDKQTYKDPVSGKTLHKSQKAAQKKYHMKNKDGENISSKWAEHVAETDHINSIKSVHDVAKHNPFLTDDDFKEIINSDENYRILSKSDNASKGEKSDRKFLKDKKGEISTEGKIQIAKEKLSSDVALNAKFAAKTIQNAGHEFVSGVSDTLVNSTIPLTTEAVRKMIKVAQGEESLGDAAKDMGKITINVAVAGGKNRLLMDVVTHELSNSKSTVLKNFVNSSEFAQIIAVAAIVQESAIRYLNGEIDGKEFVDEVGEKGTVLVVGIIGGQVGREMGGIIGSIIGTSMLPVIGTGVGMIVGEILGTIITTIACSAITMIFHTRKHLNDYKLKESQIKRLESDALKEMKNQRLKFREIVEREYKVWDETIQKGFDQILRCACEETYNLQGVTEGLDSILSVFGKEVAFKNLHDYEKQLDMPLKLRF